MNGKTLCSQYDADPPPSSTAMKVMPTFHAAFAAYNLVFGWPSDGCDESAITPLAGGGERPVAKASLARRGLGADLMQQALQGPEAPLSASSVVPPGTVHR
ncbi:hypothetical protein [Piscinibacter terrae]|uniref:Uncharacterized protein n=1 Tax=Piscinibacter terrae TaxID=2496871 RepID=A0A3N7HMB1_9BURK|nr:hypothetical protein [Albitalea terrae]RQP22753.1 hypothetical protein DZC73_20870 [Albitalea terrae]